MALKRLVKPLHERDRAGARTGSGSAGVSNHVHDIKNMMADRLINPQRAKDESAIKAIKHFSLTVAVLALIVIAAWLMVGCAVPKIEYRPVPYYMIPQQLELPKVKAEEIPRCEAGQKPCMTDETYLKFAEMVRSLKAQNAELRAILSAVR